MSHNFLRALTLSCAAVFFGTVALQAATANVVILEVPFAFHIQHQNKVLPAGEYRIERTVGSPLTCLINLKTGERVMFLNPVASEPGNNTPQFESGTEGMSLKAIG